MNSEPVSMSIAQAREELTKMQGLLKAIPRNAGRADSEYRTYLTVQIESYEKAITAFDKAEAEKKTGG